MPEEQLFKSEEQRSRAEIAEVLRTVADQLDTGTVQLTSAGQERTVEVPDRSTFEVELERQADSETEEEYYELEFELSWTE